MKRIFVLLLACSFLLTCINTVSVNAYPTNSTLTNLNMVNNYLKSKYDTESKTNTRVSDVKDSSGNEIVKYNYSGTVLLSSEFKVKNDEWVTVAHNMYGYPLIAAYGTYGNEEIKKLKTAFDDISNGKYDFTKNDLNIAWIYLDGTDYENMDTNKLKAITANANVTDKFLKEAFEVSYTFYKYSPYLVVGYEKTPDKNDGNKIYACAAQTYKYGMYYKSVDNTLIKSYNFSAVSQASASNKPQNNSSSTSKTAAKNITVTIDGNPVSFDVPPASISGRTMVPFRKIFEALGAEVGWDADTKTVTGKKAGIEIILKVGSKEALVNGEAKELDVAVTTIGGRTMVPVRFISSYLGCNVQWDENTRTVIITTTGQ